MKKTKLTRSLLAACSIVALTAVVYGCDSGPSQSELDAEMDRAEQAEMQVTMLQGQINALRMQLGLDADDDLGDNIEDLQDEVASLKQQIADAAKEAADAAEKARLAEMAATAAKLFAGIGAPMGSVTDTAATTRAAAYSGTGDAEITVNIGDGTSANTDTLSENKKAMVADNHGWKGKMYADPAGGDMVEAMVYSNVEDPTPGKKFGSLATVPNDDYQYQLTDGMITVDGTAATNAPLVGGSSFDHTAGVKTFELPANTVAVMIPGSFHGVSGTYSCTPATDSSCAAQVATDGFTLGMSADADNAFTANASAWTFKPSDPNARVMSAMDTMYASYGWWIHKTEDGKTYTASAFFDYKGGDDTAELASGVDTLLGSATYMGGAAGKYALSSSTGGTNDAGHFTARATLEADFTDNMISGTIDMFMGADGMARDWSVELMDQAVSATGVIAGDGTTGNTDRQMTKWTIGGTAGDAGGEWNGQLYNNGDDLVPMTAAGQFSSMYGQGNSMVGAFGANKQ